MLCQFQLNSKVIQLCIHISSLFKIIFPYEPLQSTEQSSLSYTVGSYQLSTLAIIVYMTCECTQSCPTLCNPVDHGLPGSSVHGISQRRILDQIPFPTPRDLPDPGIEYHVFPALAGRLFINVPPGKPLVVYMSIPISQSILPPLSPGSHTFVFLHL